jgi:hypothetical protein
MLMLKRRDARREQPPAVIGLNKPCYQYRPDLIPPQPLIALSYNGKTPCRDCLLWINTTFPENITTAMAQFWQTNNSNILN